MSFRALIILLLIAWGALAFGAPYPWAFVPLFTAATVLGVIGLLVRRRSDQIDRPTVVALAVLGIAIALQLIPLSGVAIRRISPETDAFLRRYSVGYVTNQLHALSINPPATSLALAAFAALSIFLLGSAHSLTSEDTRTLAGGVTAIGVVLAIAGLAQKMMWNGKLYGFWVPEQVGSAFGPFNNHNHFAGWMLMALPLATGLLCGRAVGRVGTPKPGWRNRLLWLSSPDANKSMLIAFSILVMAAALVVTLSRSGMFAFFVATAVSALTVARRQTTKSRRAITTVFLLFVMFAAVGWTGFGSVALRFSPQALTTLGGRIGPWKDAWHIARRFTLSGTGINTYGTAMIAYQTVSPSLHFGEAHNDYLQLLAEGGLLVSVPASIAALAFGLAARRQLRDAPGDSPDYWIRFGAIVGILAIAIQETVEFSLQMPGNAILFALLCGIAIRAVGRSRRGAGVIRLSASA